MVACKIEHRISTGKHIGHEYFRIGAMTYEEGNYPDVKRVFAPVFCMHCQNAPCIDACPIPGALYRDATGIVRIDSTKCDGCRRCITVCPYHALYFDEENCVVDKCDFCADRIKEGLQPACVSACMGRAMIFGDLDDSESAVSAALKNDTMESVGLLWPNYFDKAFRPSVFYTVIISHRPSLNHKIPKTA